MLFLLENHFWKNTKKLKQFLGYWVKKVGFILYIFWNLNQKSWLLFAIQLKLFLGDNRNIKSII